MEYELTLRIILEKPPKDVDFGLQKGRGANYETTQTQRSKGKDLSFEFTAGVKSPGKLAPPTFLGPFMQGPPEARFLYIDIGTYAGQMGSCWSRRLKIPLNGITWDMIDRLRADSKLILETRVPGTGKDGGPNCATVKPFEGWKIVRRARQ
jgi:Family of unknown function (DUF5990)